MLSVTDIPTDGLTFELMDELTDTVRCRNSFAVQKNSFPMILVRLTFPYRLSLSMDISLHFIYRDNTVFSNHKPS